MIENIKNCLFLSFIKEDIMNYREVSVPTLQFTVRSEWSVASLSKCCPFRQNHSLLKLP